MSVLGTGRVMSQIEDAGVLAAAGDLGERSSADRVGEDVGDGRRGIGQRRRGTDRQRADEALVGQVDFEAGPAVVEMDAHGTPMLRSRLVPSLLKR